MNKNSKNRTSRGNMPSWTRLERSVQVVELTAEDRRSIRAQLDLLRRVRPKDRPVAVVLRHGSLAYAVVRAALDESGHGNLAGDRLVGAVSSSMAKLLLKSLQPEALTAFRALQVDNSTVPLVVAGPSGWIGVGTLRLA